MTVAMQDFFGSLDVLKCCVVQHFLMTDPWDERYIYQQNEVMFV